MANRFSMSEGVTDLAAGIKVFKDKRIAKKKEEDVQGLMTERNQPVVNIENEKLMMANTEGLDSPEVAAQRQSSLDTAKLGKQYDPKRYDTYGGLDPSRVQQAPIEVQTEYQKRVAAERAMFNEQKDRDTAEALIQDALWKGTKPELFENLFNKYYSQESGKTLKIVKNDKTGGVILDFGKGDQLPMGTEQYNQFKATLLSPKVTAKIHESILQTPIAQRGVHEAYLDAFERAGIKFDGSEESIVKAQERLSTDPLLRGYLEKQGIKIDPEQVSLTAEYINRSGSPSKMLTQGSGGTAISTEVGAPVKGETESEKAARLSSKVDYLTKLYDRLDKSAKSELQTLAAQASTVLGTPVSADPGMGDDTTTPLEAAVSTLKTKQQDLSAQILTNPNNRELQEQLKSVNGLIRQINTASENSRAYLRRAGTVINTLSEMGGDYGFSRNESAATGQGGLNNPLTEAVAANSKVTKDTGSRPSTPSLVGLATNPDKAVPLGGMMNLIRDKAAGPVQTEAAIIPGGMQVTTGEGIETVIPNTIAIQRPDEILKKLKGQ